MPIEIVEVKGRLALRRFFRLHDRLASGGHSVAASAARPRIAAALDPLVNPAMRHTDVWMFLALQDRRTVGRIALLLETGAERPHLPPARFAMFECIDEPRVARALLETCLQEARRRGFDRLIGPVGLLLVDPLGALAANDGSAAPSVPLVSAHGPRHPDLWARAGLEPAWEHGALDVDLSRLSPAATARRPTRRRRAVSAPLDALAHALLDARRSALEHPPLDSIEQRVMQRALEALAVPGLLLGHSEREAPADPVGAIGLAHPQAQRRARRSRIQALWRGGRPIRPRHSTGHDVPPAVHLVVTAPADLDTEWIATRIAELVGRSHNQGYGRAVVTLVRTTDRATARPSLAPPHDILWSLVRAALQPGAGAMVRSVRLWGRSTRA